MLEIVLLRNAVAGGLRIPSELHVLFRNMKRRAPNFYVPAVALVRARERVGALAAVSSTHALVVVLSLPHSKALFFDPERFLTHLPRASRRVPAGAFGIVAVPGVLPVRLFGL